ncbi:ATP dependent DNA ligase domain protein [Aspergillus undulatus]|uniref:ATP dependent DNA ligase domain protein n=1 Tax=Aspergillus undulatus TaxID=1810928 RepID=UPI003CCD4B7D
MPFHKIRKFVSRSGVLIGTESDSPLVAPKQPLYEYADMTRPQPYERLIMVFFDILLLDDDVCLRKPHRERRLLLKNTIQVVSGIADIAEQHVIDFSHKDGQSKLEALFSSGIAQRWEGFVLKGCEDPYFPILTDSGAGCEGRWIKLKKDYILGLGDTVDLALVGAAYNARDATALGLVKKETWTHFFIGCLENKKDILRYNAEPRFQVIDVIDHHGMSQPNMKWLNTFAKYGARSADSCNEFDFENARPGMPQMDVVFKAPFVVEIMGAGFEKPSGARYYTLRFPRILKIHSDRSIEDTASFQELQLLAERAVSVPSDDMAEEEKEWAKRIKSSASMPGYLPDRSQSVSTTASSPVSVKTVPIHVDDRLTSSSSSDGCHEARGNVLASIGNVAIQRNTRKRKASPATSEIRYKGAYIGLGESRQTVEKVTASVLKDASSAISLVATRNDSNVDRVGISSQKSSGSTLNERVESATSPLTTFPIFIHSGTGFQSHPTVKSLTNISRNLDEFLAILIPKDHTPKLNLRKTIIGIIFTDDSKHPLESTILYLNEQISRVLAARSSTYPTKGRIFILDSKFSQVPIKWKHNRYCLRETWERISKTYFYACIAWDAEPCFGSRSKDCLDEIPSTTDDIDGDKGLDKTPKRHHGQAEGRIPKLRILFDRKEILVLGEFSSLDPLLRVGIPSG